MCHFLISTVCIRATQMVFAECGLGALILTGNVILLGGDIVFFQSLCLLGYCLFPLCVSAIICTVFDIVVSQTDPRRDLKTASLFYLTSCLSTSGDSQRSHL